MSASLNFCFVTTTATATAAAKAAKAAAKAAKAAAVDHPAFSLRPFLLAYIHMYTWCIIP